MGTLPFNPSTLSKDNLRGVGVGVSSEVVHIAGTNIVAKIPSPSCLEDHEVEKRIYIRIGQHPNILNYIGQSPPECTLLRGALLFEYHPLGSVADCFAKQKKTQKRSRWPLQVASAVAHIHSKGVVHGDLGLHNFLLHDDGRLILCDFSGSGLDGSPPNVSAGVRYLNPLFNTDYPSERDDVFALGTLLYEIFHGERLFSGKSDLEIRRHLRDKEFPDLSSVPLPLRGVIEKCWKASDYTADDALADLEPKFHLLPRSIDLPMMLGIAVMSFIVALCGLSPTC